MSAPADIAAAELRASHELSYELPADWHSRSERDRKLWALTAERKRLRRQTAHAWKLTGTLYHAAQSDPDMVPFAREQRQRAEALGRQATAVDDVIVKLVADKARDDVRRRERSDRLAALAGRVDE